MTRKATPLQAIADILGGYERLTCGAPGCDMQIRFRGVDDAEADYWRNVMAEHRQQHQGSK